MKLNLRTDGRTMLRSGICVIVLCTSLLPAQKLRALALAQTGNTNEASLGATLDKLEQTVESTNAALGRVRVDRWKADGDTRSATQTRIDSLTRNMTSALPALLQEARQKSQDSSVVFKLYRNLNALYDVLNSVTEAAGAFGSKQDYDVLSTLAASFQDEQRSVADYLERLTADTQAELVRYRTQRQAQTAATPARIVVDAEPTATPVRRARKNAAPHPTPK